MLQVMTFLSQFSNLFPTEFVWDELDKKVWREYRKSESEHFQCLKIAREGMLSIFLTLGKNAKNL